MVEYVTIQIRLTEELHKELKRRADAEDKSLTQIVRESIVQYLGRPSTAVDEGGARAEDDDPLWLIGADPVEADITNASTNHDLHLYGPLSEFAKAEIKETVYGS